MHEALFYRKNNDNTVDCFLCNHHCRIKDENYGICSVRLNRKGTLYSLSYGKVVAANIDPIEKKPLYHFLPGSKSYSIACAGCNFKCGFCQNWQISQASIAKDLSLLEYRLSSKGIVEQALSSNCPSISYTYTEPTIYFEFAYEVAKLAKEKGLLNVFVTNGYMDKQPLQDIKPYLDAANVDLKSFSEDFYRKICKASLKPVLENIILLKKLGIWIEVTTLVIPGKNDDKKELKQIAEFIVSVDKNIPWHISRFHPDFEFTEIGATSPESLSLAYDIAKEAGLKYVYVGNMDTDYENTICPACNKVIIERKGFFVESKNIEQGRCGYCKEQIKGIW
ncbi:MAG: AmmeMemoRadiSam system radical SAM enzyme [Candidatus Omnitrophica bacterium]|jgi:pyruvate formate lyase activating enzyme|nr:AmmeMemoRadiSam system radical SAM enzyme [Candidatus Omnitrophota bacterium]